MMRNLVVPPGKTRFVFFGGKGGVGKSSISAATAVWLADQGFKILLVSTDLQRSLSDIFETDIGYRLASIPDVPTLTVMETEPRELVRENWHRLAGTVQEVFGPSDLLDLMSKEVTPCMMEMASFYKLMELFTESARDFHAIVFDTAPGGRALIEIALPFTMAKRYGEGDIFAEFHSVGSDKKIALIASQERRTKETLELITNPTRTVFIYILWLESLPIAETQRAVEELSLHRITVPGIIINQALPLEEVQQADTPFFWARYEMQQQHLTHVREIFGDKEIAMVPLLSGEVKGVSLLRQLAADLYRGGSDD